MCDKHRFVVVLPEEYDIHEYLHPHPVETEFSRGELQRYFNEFWVTAVNWKPGEDLEVNHRRLNHFKEGTIPGTQIKFCLWQISRLTGAQTYGFRCPEIYTLNEWFELKGNKLDV